MSTNIFNSADEWAVQTPAQTFPAEVDSEIRRLEREGARAAMEESRKRSADKLTTLRGNLILAWRNLVEESSISESLEVIAADVHNLAEEFGKFHSRERFVLAEELFAIAEAAGRSNL